MEHLAGRGITCPPPVTAATARRCAARRAAGALVTFLGAVGAPAAGAAIARRRRGAGATAPGGRGLSRDARQRALGRPAGGRSSSCRARADEVQPGSRRLIDAELDLLAARWPTDLPPGVIHADFFPDNVFFLGDGLPGLIDFYFACNDLLAYDMAVCLNAWCFEPDGTFNVTKARALVGRLRARAAARGAEREALPLLARGAALRFLLTRLYDWLQRPDRRAGQAEGPAGVRAQAALPPRRSGPPRDYGIASVTRPTGRRSTPTAPARAIPGRAAGARS